MCKPLQHRCHHSREAYFSPQNAPKPFGCPRHLKEVGPWERGRRGMKGDEEGEGEREAQKERVR